MQTNKLTQIPTFNNTFQLSETSSKMPISEVFAERNSSYLNEFMLFTAHFNAIPNQIYKRSIECEKANNWFVEKYKDEIKDHYYFKSHTSINNKLFFKEAFYFLYDDLIIHFEMFNETVNFLFRKTELSKIETLIREIHKFRRKKNIQKPEIYLLIYSMAGLETKSMQIRKPKLSIDENYNDDFKEVHTKILKKLSQNNGKGLVLLHGKPGTGKTSYIKYLAISLKKNVVFLPPNLSIHITNPEMISILIDHPNSIFVIEDAENIMIDREKDGNSPVSTLLNISDGLLADCLNVQLICSFNTETSNIDKALMRKGRLIAHYEFTELETEKAQKLSDKLGFKTIINKPMTLTSIYNQEESDLKTIKPNNPIGFKSIINSVAEN